LRDYREYVPHHDWANRVASLRADGAETPELWCTEFGSEEPKGQRMLAFDVRGVVRSSRLIRKATVSGMVDAKRGGPVSVRLKEGAPDRWTLNATVRNQPLGDYLLSLNLRIPSGRCEGLMEVWQACVQLRSGHGSGGQTTNVFGSGNITSAVQGNSGFADRVRGFPLDLIDIEFAAQDIPPALFEFSGAAAPRVLIATGRGLVIGRSGGTGRCGPDEVFISHEVLGCDIEIPHRISSRSAVLRADLEAGCVNLRIEQAQVESSDRGPKVNGERVTRGYQAALTIDNEVRIELGFDGIDAESRMGTGSLCALIRPIACLSDKRTIGAVQICAVNTNSPNVRVLWLPMPGARVADLVIEQDFQLNADGTLTYFSCGSEVAKFPVARKVDAADRGEGESGPLKRLTPEGRIAQ